MRIRKPSPAMVVSIIALVMASTGSAVAAVSFARNAGAVDGLSAVDAGSSNNRARGRLVATARGGSNPGRIPAKFLAGVTHSNAIGNFFDTPDNATGAQVEVASTTLGSLRAACSDQAPGAGIEDPTSTVTFAASREVNLYRRVGNGDQHITTLVAGTTDSFTINGQNSFRIHVESFGTNIVLEGFVRQLNPRTANGSCLILGTEELVT